MNSGRLFHVKPKASMTVFHVKHRAGPEDPNLYSSDKPAAIVSAHSTTHSRQHPLRQAIAFLDEPLGPLVPEALEECVMR